jgi:diguanylate cyclase (GGDEF)-like protein
MRRALTTLLVPEGLILLAAAAAIRWPLLLHPIEPVLRWLPAVVLVAGSVLALRFRQSGVLFALVALAGAGGVLSWAAGARTADTQLGALEPALAILLPLNLLAFALLPERGFTSAAALRRVAALVAQAALVFVLARPDQRPLADLLTARPLTERLVAADAPLGDASLLLFAGAAIVFVTLTIRRAAPLLRGFLWALAAVLVGLAAGAGRLPGGTPTVGLLFTAAGLILVVAVIETAHALAFRDALTGLASRRALDDALRRLDGPFAIAMVDVDHFKSVNDTHGHEVGDQVLRMVAAQLDGVDGGLAFRYGGEEFAILFAGRTADDVAPVLEGLRSAVAAQRFTLRAADRPRRRPKQARRRSGTGAGQLGVTVSLGLACRAAGDGDVDAAVREADAALYRAKRAGRNRLETAGARRGR